MTHFPDRRRLLALAAAAALAVSRSAAAQAGREGPGASSLAGQCQAAASILKQGPAHPRRAWAVEYIQVCPEQGPAHYADQWRRAAADTDAVQALLLYSAGMRDARVYSAASDVARDRSRPPVVRVAAMLLLAKYVDPANALSIETLTPPESIGRIPLLGGWRTDVVVQDGAERLGPVAADVLGLLEPIAANRAGEPRAVWYAAAVLSRRVRADIAAGRAR